MDRAEGNAYEILGIPPGPKTTEADIKKAYRKLALIKHPDKNIGNPRAAEEFFQIQQAYDLLLDTNGRAALDAYLRVRAVNLEKKATHDEKRRHVYEDLVKREQAAEGLKEEESAKARLKAEIERMRQTAEARRPSSRPSPKPAAPQDTDALGRRGNSDEPLDDVSARTLKISWFRETTGVAYDEAQLRAIFSKYGAVEDIIMREGKKKKGSALITLMRQEDAKKALKTASGDPKNPLLVLPLCATEGKVGDRGRSKNETSQGISYKPLSMSPSSAKVGAAGSLGARPVKPLFPAAATRRSD